MRFDILTLFPDMFPGYLGQSILNKSIERGLVEIHVHNMRDWATGKHHKIDDTPYGGGAGMVLMVDPVVRCVRDVQSLAETKGTVILLTPSGRRLDQVLVEKLAGVTKAVEFENGEQTEFDNDNNKHNEKEETNFESIQHDSAARLIVLCGRYEGFDQRVIDILKPLELSIGDYILNGGEVAAMVLIDSLVRMIPGVLGDENSNVDDSFSRGNRLLEYPHYTRPQEFEGLVVPEILLSGNHQEIERWRTEQSLQKTKQRRADLLG